MATNRVVEEEKMLSFEDYANYLGIIRGTKANIGEHMTEMVMDRVSVDDLGACELRDLLALFMEAYQDFSDILDDVLQYVAVGGDD